MRSLWWRRFFHWAIYLLLVAYLPTFGLLYIIFHHFPGGFTVGMAAVLWITSSAQQAQKETRGKKPPATKPPSA